MERISKQKAKRLFETGKEIIIVACKMRIGAPWFPECSINKATNYTFDNLINNFIYLNCSYETGYYPHYYIEEVIK